MAPRIGVRKAAVSAMNRGAKLRTARDSGHSRRPRTAARLAANRRLSAVVGATGTGRRRVHRNRAESRLPRDRIRMAMGADRRRGSRRTMDRLAANLRAGRIHGPGWICGSRSRGHRLTAGRGADMAGIMGRRATVAIAARRVTHPAAGIRSEVVSTPAAEADTPAEEGIRVEVGTRAVEGIIGSGQPSALSRQLSARRRDELM